MGSNKVPKIAVRGVRQSLPSGFLIGRLSPGEGPAELIPIQAGSGKSLTAALTAQGYPPAASSKPIFYDAGVYLQGGGALFAGQYYPLARTSRAIIFPSTAGLQSATCEVAPATAALFWITTNLADFAANGGTGADTICSITFAANSKTGTVAQVNQLTVVALAVLYLVVDVNFSDTVISGVEILLRGDPA